jgi:transcriptional regulator with XRE-family HTH domain
LCGAFSLKKNGSPWCKARNELAPGRQKLTSAISGRAAIVRYRAEHDLSQRELAERLGMKQPQVARLELGEANPTVETLMRIASRLRIELTIDVRPAGSPALNVSGWAQAEHVVGGIQAEHVDVLVAAR